jgi:hypothetical protein
VSNRHDKIPVLKNVVLHHALEDRDRYERRHQAYALWQKGMAARDAYPEDPVRWRQLTKSLYRKIPTKELVLFVYFYIGRLGFLEYKNNLAIYKEKRKYHISK